MILIQPIDMLGLKDSKKLSSYTLKIRFFQHKIKLKGKL